MKKYGHRGACGHAPENTLASFRRAIEMGVDGIEFDIQLSKDGEPVVIHDESLERTTSGSGNVADFTYAELQKFDAGNGEKIPHLNDVFALADKRCELLIELKCDAVAVVEKIIRAQVAKGWKYEQLPVLSFNHFWLQDIRRINPEILTCASFEAIPVSLAAIGSEAGAGIIGPYVGAITQALVDDAHARGMKVVTWTANTPEQIAAAKALGVDGIISDYPERL
ncbi:MAG: glycerophosphodiester phosphodiesterase family protein [Alphaproteobacteria bacterium]|nr:glycerophosphodiester phosphodiesterase family protein [Alphaproteobacteria bacterium]